MRFRGYWALGSLVLVSAGCGSSSGGGGAASCTPGPTAAMTLSSMGLSPPNVCVQPGGTVTFSNTDTVAHDIEFSTPASCPTVGSIASGGHVGTVFPTVVNCTFHDGNQPSNAAFQGTVAVTSGTVMGGGY